MNDNYKFTDAEMKIDRNTDLPDLLSSLGYQVTRVGNYHSTKEMDSIRIKDRRTWRRYSEQVGGDAITFLQHFQNMGFREAVEHLLAFNGRSRDSPAETQRAKPALKGKVTFVLPDANTDNRRVFAYLQKRGIASQVIRAFLSVGLLYEDAEHHNCVFVGKDAREKPVFATKRGSYDLNGSGFRGDVPGSNKDVAFRMPCDPNQNHVYVFEAPIDLMSLCTLHREVTGNAVALCCLYDGALKTYLQENPQISHIILCLDNDKWGKEAASRLKNEYTEKGYAVSINTPPHGKDWNEYLLQKHRTQERGR